MGLFQLIQIEPGPRLTIPAGVLVRHGPSLGQAPGLHLAHRIPAGALAREHLPEKRHKRDPWAVDPIALTREDLRRDEPADQSRQAVQILCLLPQSFARHTAFGPFGRARFHRLADDGFRHRSTLPASLPPPCYEPVTICLNLAPFRPDPFFRSPPEEDEFHPAADTPGTLAQHCRPIPPQLQNRFPKNRPSHPRPPPPRRAG